MRALFLIFLASYAVKCDDDASYYVVEIPEQTRQETKQFRVYWNVPTMQCKSKKVPFENLYERFGIIQNTGDSFRGDEVAILYDPGVFPALLKNETSGKFKFRNGGVPQEGDLEKHWNAFRKVLEQSIPDPEFSGIGIIDFESWRPIFRQNFGVLAPYKDFSYQIERKQHWFWPEKAIQARAKQRFEEAARSFMQTTLVIAREMRPLAQWGYYAFPYCFNTVGGSSGETCPSVVQQENDKIGWLWHSSTALYPSTYVSRGISLSQLRGLLRGRVAEAARVRRHAPILPYFWFRYREGGYLSQEEINVILDTFYKSSASGFIIWGSSNDVNTVDKCKNLLKYTEEILGPSIAKYTKRRGEINSNKVRPITIPLNSDITTWMPILKEQLNISNNITNAMQNIYHPWFAVENNSPNITHNYEYAINNTNSSSTSHENSTNLLHIKKNTLLELLFKILLYKKVANGDDTENVYEDLEKSEAISHNIDTKQSSYLNLFTDSVNNNTIIEITPYLAIYTTLKPPNITETVITENTNILNSSENITVIQDTNTFENLYAITNASTNYQNNSTEEIIDENNFLTHYSIEESESVQDLITENVTETNIITKDLYASLENETDSSEYNSSSESSFNFIDTSTPTNNVIKHITADVYLFSETDNETTSNLLINITSTYRTDALFEAKDMKMQNKDEKKGYHFKDNENDSTTSKDTVTAPLDFDQVTSKDLLLASTANLEYVTETDNFTETLTSSTANTETVTQLNEKQNNVDNIGSDNYAEIESISEQHLSSTEFTNTLDNKYDGESKNLTNIFYEHINSTTENIVYTLNDSEDSIDDISDNEVTTFSDETTTDSVRLLPF